MILLLILLLSCSKSEVVEMPPQTKSIDTTYTPRHRDTTKKHPIRFDIHITDWEDVEVNI